MKRKFKRNMELIGIALILIGIFAIVVGFLILAFSKDAKVESGGIMFIGPVPIIFGTSMKMVYIVMFLALVIMLLYLFLILFLWR